MARKRKDELAMAEAQALKVIRTAIRLKYSLEADRELNEVEPAASQKIRDAFAQGKGWHIDPVAIWAGEDVIDAIEVEGE